MLVERITWLAKVGHAGEVVEMLRDLNEQVGGFDRIYLGLIGPDDETVVVEFEFETMEDRDKGWQDAMARPEVREATQKMRPLMQSGGVHEIWRLY